MWSVCMCGMKGREKKGCRELFLPKICIFLLICWFWSSVTFVAMTISTWFSEWPYSTHVKPQKGHFSSKHLSMPTVLTSGLIVRVIFCILHGVLSDVVLEKQHQREKGLTEKQHWACRNGKYLQRVNKLEIRIPCKKQEQRELGNDFFLFFSGGVKKCATETP